MILHLRERDRDRAGHRLPLSLPVLALAALARPEGLLLLALAAADRLLVFRRSEDGERGLAWAGIAGVDWRRLAAGLLLALCVLAGPLLFYRFAGGTFLPTTYAAKGAAVRRSLPNLQYLAVIFGILFAPQPYAALAALGGGTQLASRLGTPRDRGLLPALWVFGLPLAYSLQSPIGRGLIAGNLGRYYFPLFPPLAVLGVLGLEPAARAVGRRLRLGDVRLPVGPLAAALLLWPTAASLVEWALRYEQNVANVEDSDVRVARWLAPRLDPRAVLAVNDIGALKYLLPNRVIDLVGIATPALLAEVQRDAADGVPVQEARLAALARRQPDYVVVFPEWFPALAEDRRFRLLQTFAIPDNHTMGGDQIAVYATPWTRHPLAPDPPNPPAPAGDAPPASR